MEREFGMGAIRAYSIFLRVSTVCGPWVGNENQKIKDRLSYARFNKRIRQRFAEAA